MPSRLDSSSLGLGAPAPAGAGSAAGLPSEPGHAHAVATRAAARDLAATQEFLGYVWPTLSRVASGVLGAQHPDLGDAV